MSMLSLSKGDSSARERLQQAIRARYALRPIMVDSVRITMKGQGKGILGLPVQRHITMSMVAVNQWRWEETRKLLGLLPTGSSATLLENGIYYEKDGKVLIQSDSPEAVQGIRRMLWAMLAFLLTPLTAQGVTLKSIDGQTIEASRDSDLNDVVNLTILPDGNINVHANCYDLKTQQSVKLSIASQGLLQTLDGFTIPAEIVFTWDTGKSDVLKVTGVEVNPHIAPADLARVSG